jgi:hippurate hydrolase
MQNKLKLLAGILLTSTFASVTHAQKNMDIPYSKIRDLAESDRPRLIEIFKDIHQNPEIGFEEVRTAAIVAKELTALGYEAKTGIGKTGVVGALKNGDGPVIMWRADMDELGVLETTNLPYASTKTTLNAEGQAIPVMHACGHDAHTTWLLGIAKIMALFKNEWKGTLLLVAQPAEEPGGGADAMALEMYKQGVPVPKYLLGMHTAPVPVGYYLNMPGDRHAGADQLDVAFYGIGGHGSQPQDTKDPVLMAANAIIQYQTLISRSMDPQRPAVLTVGAVQIGTDNNIIPAKALLKLNLRWFTQEDRQIMVNGIQRINEGIAIANDLPKELYPVMNQKQFVLALKNDESLVNKIQPALDQVLGADKNLKFPPVMGSEDFHHLVKDYPEVKYNYMLFGIADPKVFARAQEQGKKFPFTNHNGDFQVDLSAIPLGVITGTSVLLKAFK